ncbi:type II secretion system minor pseudopilin GspK [uncultured Xylophilus sp.]|uniref:type II secretion system minor pseudopilin GspK n=1 Tax=uncultured Xylophilus sp. TaxID=296832 RepID=UPI0025E6FFD8|nr:type II secretion system minor pseudopilin GspK [uncultured Xylophilus sp.]
MRRSQPLRQAGAALLAAMLTVTLVATFAAAAMWQQWRNVEVEATERARVQAGWILVGALDWSRLILREDYLADLRTGAGQVDHLAEPWAVPLQEARLSSFLAADRDNTVTAPGNVQDAFLSGQIRDAQARMNFADLVDNGQLSDFWYPAFQRLFEQLGLPQPELARIAQGMVAAQAADAATAPLLPQRLAQFAWYGVSPGTLQALEPYATILPDRTPINLNTASATVLAAAVPQLDGAGAQRLVAARAAAPLRTTADAVRAIGNEAVQLNPGAHSVFSVFFEIAGRLRLENAVVEERSLVRREGSNVRTLWRERGALGVAQALQTGTGLPPLPR